MKKVVMVLLFASVTMVSCKEKLPSNISSVVWSINSDVTTLNQVDSIILNLSDDDINRLSKDSALSLYSKHNYYEESYNKSYDELQKLLVYNPEYSDYDEVKKIKYHFTITSNLSPEEGVEKLFDNVQKLFYKSIK